ncbi:MAG: PIN domain-containing protein [Methylococcaceae bacterium]|nr:PIN domain-containing protein [Methylococcaceae bacterium]
MNKIIADTGFWVALANHKDKYHSQAKKCYQLYHPRLITTDYVMAETCHLLLREINAGAQVKFLKAYQIDAFEVFDFKKQYLPRLIELMNKYQDLPMDLADGSLVILAEQLGHGKILSTDQRDFNTYRWKQNKPFENLLFL